MAISRNFKGIWIPAQVWLDKRLSYFERCLLAELNSLDGDDGCYASNQYLSEFFNERERKIQEGISKLKSLGYIQVSSFDGRIRVLKTNLNPENPNEELQENDKSLFSTSDMLNSAPLHSGIPHPSTGTDTIYSKEEKTLSCSVNSKNSGPSIRNISKKNTKGDPVSITYEEIFRRCVFEKKDWSIPEIEEAWDILNDYDKPVSDLFALMESIVENQRTNKTKQKRKQQEEKNKPKLSKGPAVCTEPPGKPIPKEMWGKPTL